MDGKKYFCECCKDLGIDHSKLFKLGNQNTEEKGQLKFHPYYNPEKQSQIFAVNHSLVFVQQFNLSKQFDLRHSGYLL